MENANNKELKTIMAAMMQGDLTKQQAERSRRWTVNPGATGLALLAASKRILELQAKHVNLPKIDLSTLCGSERRTYCPVFQNFRRCC